MWKRNFRVFSGLVMGTSFENGIPVSFWAFLKIMPISSIWKRDFLFFWACDGNFWKIISISSIWKRNFRVFSGLVMGTSFENGISVSFWAFLENNASIFYLKTGFPFFWACDGNLWKIMPISSIWKRDFRWFFGLWWQPLENNANIFYLKTGFPCLFGLFWKIVPISSIWKRDFPFFGLVMGTSGK